MRKLLFFLLIPLGMAIFYAGFALHAWLIVRDAQLSKVEFNAVKHADAAKGVYTLLHRLHIPSPDDKVIWLGILSERFEQLTKFKDPDSTLEMMKDSYNNIAGVAAAEWDATHEKLCKEPSLVILARTKLLRFTPDDMKMPAAKKKPLMEGRDVPTMIAFVQDHRTMIRKSVIQALTECSSMQETPSSSSVK